MAPRSFSTDGAQGAFGGGTANPGAIGGVQMNDPGMAIDASAPPANNTGSPFGNRGSNDVPGQNGRMVNINTSLGGFTSPTLNPADEQALWGGLSFADGGSMPDTGGSSGDATGDATGGTNDNSDLVSLALATVDSALQYGRQKYGLGDGDQQQAGAMPTIPGNQSNTPGPYVPQQPRPQPQQVAANMPTVPGSQSNSGIPPQQPMPGPLPPTSNPFGKRTRLGAIPDDEEEAA